MLPADGRFHDGRTPEERESVEPVQPTRAWVAIIKSKAKKDRESGSIAMLVVKQQVSLAPQALRVPEPGRMKLESEHVPHRKRCHGQFRLI